MASRRNPSRRLPPPDRRLADRAFERGDGLLEELERLQADRGANPRANRATNLRTCITLRRFLEFMRRCRAYTDGPTPRALLTLNAPADDGQAEREVEIVGSPRPADGTERPYVLTAVIDLTDRNRLERERRRAEEEGERVRQNESLAAASAQAKDQFLARLSHELRTPLTPVLAALTDPKLTEQAPPNLREALTICAATSSSRFG